MQVLACPILEVGRAGAIQNPVRFVNGCGQGEKKAHIYLPMLVSLLVRCPWTARVHVHPDKDKIRRRGRTVDVGEW